MKLLLMRKCSWAMSGAFVACLTFAAHGSANVFDDAVFWFRGGKDISGDHCMQQGEFFDDLHANDNGHPNHSKLQLLSYSGAYAPYKQNAAILTERVVFPALGQSVTRNMRVLHLLNNAINNKGTDYYWPQCFAPGDIFSSNNISNEYTIVSRMKLDDDGLVRTQCVFRIGYDATAKQGMWLGFSEIDETTKTKHITCRCTPTNSEDDTQFDFDSIQIPTNTWFDMAIVVGKNKLRVGITVPRTYGSNPTVIFAETNMWTDGISKHLGGTYYRMFGYSEQNRATSVLANMEKSCFIGSVQQLGIWGRALSDQEVMAAFGMPRPAIFRTGFDNGDSTEFGGTRSGAEQTIDGLGSWQDIANTMLAGDEWTVNFNALRDEAGLPQIFSIKALSDSAVAQIEPILNETSLRERRVAANGRTFWPVPKDIITEGANTLVIKRKTSDAGELKIDAMELGGSLGVGIETGSITDDQRTSPERTKTGVPSAADPNTYHWPQGLQPSTGITNLHFRVWVDPDVADKVTSRFWTHTRRKAATEGTETFTLFVNGVPKTNSLSSASWEETELTFQPGGLNGGWNDFEFISPSNSTCYWEFGYYRFETVLPKGFSIPQPGMTVFIK